MKNFFHFLLRLIWAIFNFLAFLSALFFIFKIIGLVHDGRNINPEGVAIGVLSLAYLINFSAFTDKSQECFERIKPNSQKKGIIGTYLERKSIEEKIRLEEAKSKFESKSTLNQK